MEMIFFDRIIGVIRPVQNESREDYAIYKYYIDPDRADNYLGIKFASAHSCDHCRLRLVDNDKKIFDVIQASGFADQVDEEHKLFIQAAGALSLKILHDGLFPDNWHI